MAEGETPRAVEGAVDGGEPGQQPQTWDDVLGGLAPEVRALYEAHVGGLSKTVAATRQERDALQQRLAVMRKALDGKEPEALRRELDQLQEQLTESAQRATFYEEAVKPGVGCRDARLAYLVAKQDNLFLRTGAPDWEAIRAAAPLLFGPPVPAGNAGSGTQTPPRPSSDMNEWIRNQMGRHR